MYEQGENFVSTLGFDPNMWKLSTADRKVTFPMGSFGAPTIKQTTLLVLMPLNTQRLTFEGFPSLSPAFFAKDLGHPAKHRQSSFAAECEAVESMLGEEIKCVVWGLLLPLVLVIMK